MLDWKNIWIKKGKLSSFDLKLLNGFEKTTVDPSYVATEITKVLEIKKDTKVLEVGCGAGMLAQFLDCDYTGIDYSHTLVKKHKEVLNNKVYTCEANNIFFENKSFDCVFAYSVFQYFPDLEYAKSVIQEMKRLSRNTVFIGDLPFLSHEENHLLYDKDMFFDHTITCGYYNPQRFNVFMDIR